MTNSILSRITRGRIDGLTKSLPNGTSWRLSWSWLLCLLLGHSATALAAELRKAPLSEVPVVQTDNMANARQKLANYSDQQIGVMLQRWPQLDAAQRRDLLAEVRKRMRQATAVNASKETAKTRSSGPSLTLRIKRAQSAHSYGRQGVRPRSQAMTQGTTQRQGQPPRDVVIRTTVTQILPDGSRLTREETLVPRSLRKDLVQPQQPNLAAATPNTAAVQSQAKGTVRVIRAKVRFGAGFDRRSQSNAESAAQARRVSTSEVAEPVVVQGSRSEGK